MPWEETEDFVRSGHRNPDDFQPDSMRTIAISQKEGIKAVIGKPKGKKTTEVQSYLFAKDKGWTLEKAKVWFEKHKSESLPGHALFFDLQFLTEKADPEARIFPWSMPAKYYMKPGRMVVYGTALVAGETRKGDKFNCEELTRAARGLVGGPIEVFEHTWDVGESRWLPFPDNIILDGEEVDGRLEYIAGVADLKVQELIREKTIAKVSVNTICRHVPAEDPGQCDGMILNGFCLLHKDSVPASPGTSVQIWNCLKVNPDRLKSASMPCLSEPEEGKNMTEKNGEKPPETKTEQEVTGHGPVAGVPEPSIEDRVKTLEEQFKNFQRYTSEDINNLRTQVQTLIQLQPAIATSSVPPTKTEQEGEGEREKLHQAAQERAQKYGIGVKEGGNLTKPSEYEDVPEDQFADPVNYRYPVTEKYVQGAITYFNQPDNRQAGGYTHEEAVKIMTKIVQAALNVGKEVSYQPEDPVYKDLPEDLKSKLKGYEKPEKKTEKASPPPQGQGITKPIGQLPPAQPGVITVTEIRKVFNDPRLFTPQLREKEILRLIRKKEADGHD